MFHVSSTATLVALAVSAVLLAGPAHAQVDGATLRTDRRGGVFGAELNVRSAAAPAVVFRLWTPRAKDGSRRLWGRCRLPNIGTAEYRCEFDVSGTSRRMRARTWLVTVRSGSRFLAERLELIR